nr:hypothetical protein [Nitratireductor aquibiodomus]
MIADFVEEREPSLDLRVRRKKPSEGLTDGADLEKRFVCNRFSAFPGRNTFIEDATPAVNRDGNRETGNAVLLHKAPGFRLDSLSGCR